MFIPGPGGLTAERTGNTLWVDAVNGGDASALPDRADKPYLTLTAAKAAAQAGDLARVRPGIYEEQGIEAGGINWLFDAGTVVSNVALVEAVTLAFSAAGTYRVYGRAAVSNDATNVIDSTHAGADWEVECVSLTGPPAAGYPAVSVSAGTGLIRGAAIAADSSNTGAVLVGGGTLTLDRCTITAPPGGACVYQETGGVVVLRDCKLIGTPFGGGFEPTVRVEGTLTLDTAPDPSVTLLGGHDPLTMPEASVTGAATARLGRAYVCSGTTADYTVTLPTPTAGSRIAFRMSSALTRLVTLDAGVGVAIDGQQTRVLWAGESAVLLSDGVGWSKVAGRTVPMLCKMRQTAGQSIPNSSLTKVTLDAADADTLGRMADTTNRRVNVLRGGRYKVTAGVRFNGLSANASRIENLVNVNADGLGAQYAFAEYSALAGSFPFEPGLDTLDLAAGDYITLIVYQNAGVAQNTYGHATDAASMLLVEEVPTW